MLSASSRKERGPFPEQWLVIELRHGESSGKRRLALKFLVKNISIVTVFDAILTSRQTRERLQCLYENPMSNNFRKTAVLKKI